MWMSESWAAPMWSLWWIFPLIGLAICFALLVIALRFIGTGRGFMCMGGRQGVGSEETSAMRREIEALREEIKHLKASR
jgi:hypothetical protein